jgi:mRNA interferase HigB
MRVISHKRIREAQERWPQSATALQSWYAKILHNDPISFAHMRSIFPSADFVGKLHVFDIGGNKIRLIAGVSYSTQQVFIKHVLSHAEYDKDKWKE